MENQRLKATHRTVLGKKTRFLRRQGMTPAHLYGHNVQSLALQCDTENLRDIIAHAGRTRLIDLEIDGDKPKSVFVREIQRDAISRELLHVDFYQVKRTEKISVAVPIVLVGESFWREAVNVDFLVAEGVIDPEDRELFWYAETAADIWDGIRQWHVDNGTPLFK